MKLKELFWILFVVLLGLSWGLFGLKRPVLARVVSGDRIVSIAEGEVVDEDLFVSAGTVTVAGTIHGNLFVAGGQVKVTGTIGGSVFAGAGALSLENAKVQGNLVAGGGSVSLVSTQIENGVIVGAGDLSVDKNSQIGGGLAVAAGNLDLVGPVGKGMVAVAGSALLNSSIEKDVQLRVGQLTLGQEAHLKGNLSYTSDQRAKIDSAAQVTGKVTRKEAAGKSRPVGGVAGFITKISLGFRFFSYFSTLLIGLLIVFLFPKDAQKVTENLLQKPWRSLGMGFLILVLTLPAVLLLILSLIGIPLAVLTLLFWGAAIYLSRVFIGLLFGQALLETLGRNATNLYLSLMVGLAVYQVLTVVPFLGWFVGLATPTFGLGALFMCGRDYVLQNKATTPSVTKG